MNNCNDCIHMCYHVRYWIEPTQNGRKMCDIKSKRMYDIMLDDFVKVRLVPCVVMRHLPFCEFEPRQINRSVNGN